jgi:DNA mismatch repair protein MSH6
MDGLSLFVEGADELVPVDGKDDVYDGIMTEIRELEQELDEQLKKFEKSLGYEFSARDLPRSSC